MNILSIEDNDADYELICKELRVADFPFTIERVKTKSSFEAYFASRRPDIILCEYRLHGFPAVEIIDFLTSRGFDIPVVLVTAAVNERHAANLLRKGVEDLILKDRLLRLPSSVFKAVELRQISREK